MNEIAIPQPSTLLLTGFILLPLAVVALFVCGCGWATARSENPRPRGSVMFRAAAAAGAWLLVTALLAQSGLLRRFDIFPPPFAVMMATLFALAVSLSFSRFGSKLARALPLWALVGFQAFRFPLELLMHRAYREGVMPVQMSYSGYNFDIVSGITAGLLALWLIFGQPPKSIVVLWNLLGSLLLVAIIANAVLSSPIFRFFGDDHLNLFVTYFPFVWLPAVLVTAALVGHLLMWRRLLMSSAASADRSPR